MATASAVAVGTLPTSPGSPVDLTVPGFGTVDAAILILGRATAANNPKDDVLFSVGFWDGINTVQHATSIFCADGLGTTATSRFKYTDAGLCLDGSRKITISAVTNGITLTLNTSTTAGEYVQAIFFKGVTDVHLAELSLGTGTSAIDITAPAFKPDIVFFASICDSTSGNTSGSNAIMSFGVAHNDSANNVTQGACYLDSVTALSTVSKTRVYSSATNCIGQMFDATVNWEAAASDFDTNGFSLTPTASAGNDYISYLAIKLADPDDAWVSRFLTPTSPGTSATTGVGFTPDTIGMFGTVARSGGNPNEMDWCFGVADSTNEQSLFFSDRNSVATSIADGEADLSRILRISAPVTTDLIIASVDSFDADGFTLNYTTVDANARYVLAFAIGDSTAGGVAANPHNPFGHPFLGAFGGPI